jgi:pimeloyl-ACP methyl ester carboxylesterase
MTPDFPGLIFWGAALFVADARAFDGQPAATVVTDLAYVTPDRRVDIGGGRKMNIYCVGHGSPTVVLEAGLGDQINAWALVQPQISSRTRVCSYDRAGLGFSDASSRPGTSANAMDDLHRLLGAASIKPPYILVGHSLGGMYVRLYADEYRSEVAGLVLVDPVSEEQGRRYNEIDSSTKTLNDEYVARIRDQCLPAAVKGFETGSAIYKQCVGEPDPHFSAAFNVALSANQSTVTHFQAVWSEWINVFTISSDQVRRARRSFGDMPLIVLSRVPFERQPNETREMRDAKNHLWMELHDDMARLSTRGINRVVPRAGHYIQFDQPGAAIAAVFEVLDQTTSTTPTR